jgi:hypothetical protein
MRPSFFWSIPCLLLATLACGGGGNPTPQPAPAATPAPTTPKLTYVDPTSGDYRWIRNASLSTDSHLVLDLMGPATGQGRGIAFTLTADASKTSWAKPTPSDADFVAPSTFDLGAAPLIFKVKRNGGIIDVAFSQKGSSVTAKALNGVLARVALDSLPGASGTVSLSASHAQLLPASGAPQSITLSIASPLIP